MSHYFLSQEAEEDIDEIVSYMAYENPTIALKFLDRLYQSMERLADNPMMGHKRQDLSEKPVRFCPFKWHYLIIYKDISPIEIVRVLSGYRDIARLV